jgi:ribose 5-phosphate isomerase A
MDFKKQAAEKAVTLVKDKSIVGIGAGSTMAHIVFFLKEAMQNGLDVQVATSAFITRQLLQQNGFNVLNTGSLSALDIYFDGCDQFDKNLHALKSGGGIHTQEKLLATMAREFVLVGDEGKYAEELDTKFPVVTEVLPQASAFVPLAISKLFPGTKAVMRTGDKKDGPVITENGNYLFDIWFTQWPGLSQINPVLKTITGIVETSLFYNIASKAVIAGEKGIVIMEKNSNAG